MIITSDLYSLDLGLIPGKGSNMWSDAEVAIKFHKLEVGGSNPLSATTFNKIWCSVTMNTFII